MMIHLKTLAITLALLAMGLGASYAPLLTTFGTGTTIGTLDQFSATTSPYTAIQTRTHAKSLYIPYSTATTSRIYATTFCINLSSPDCITSWPTGSGSGFATTSADYWLTQRNFWATSSADYWETQQTSRSSDNLTDNSIEDLSDVAAMTEAFGNLLSWNGSAWTNIATSTLRISWTDLTNIPAGFADGTDNTGSGGTGLATSTAIADDQIIVGTSAADVGSYSTLTFNNLTSLFTVPNASTTLFSTSYASSTQWRGGGLISDCDADTAALSWDTTTGQFVCGDDDDTTYTAGDALTLTGNDIDFDGGATPAGDLGGTWASPSVTDDSHNHTSASISGIDISADTNLTAGDGITLTDDDLDCDTASGTAFGCLTAADWTSFNGRVSTTSIDTITEVETLWGVTNILIENDIDASSELAAIMDDETGGTGNLVFSGGPTFSGLTTFANASSTLFSTAYASSTLYYGAGLATCESGNMLTWAGGRFGCEADDTSVGGGTFPFTPTTNFGQAANATTTALWLQASGYSLMASSSVAFGNGTAAGLRWDSTNGRLGVGTMAPSEILHIYVPSGSFGTMRLDSGNTQGYLWCYDGDDSCNLGTNSDSYLYFKQNNATRGYIDKTTGNWTIQNSEGDDSIFSLKAPSSQPEEATFTAMLDLGSGNTEFLDLTIEDFAGYDHMVSLNSAASGTQSPLPIAFRFWDQDLGVVAEKGVYSTIWHPNGGINFGVASTSISTTSLLYAASSTATNLLRIDSAIGTNRLNLTSAGVLTVSNASTTHFSLNGSTQQFWEPLGVTYATSSWTGTTTIELPSFFYPATITHAYCRTNTGTVGVSLYDGTNRANYIAASTTQGLITYSSNNSFNAGEVIQVDIGTPASSPRRVVCAFKYDYD